MTADLSLLNPAFKNSVEKLIQNCLAREVYMHPIEGLRTLEKQAMYWRQSRTIKEINSKISELETKQAHFLASIISNIGPQYGSYVTNAIPGLSWHQWGKAVNCIWIAGGKAVWDIDFKINGVNGYLVYAEEAKKLGLNAGAYWQTFKNFAHVQSEMEDNLLEVYTLTEINNEMEKLFKGNLKKSLYSIL
ncbi:MAG: M15 family metallopeptidase [Bacteroidia bacterium]